MSEYVSLVVSITPVLKKVLPWKEDPVAIPVQSLSSGGFDDPPPTGVGPYGGSEKVIILLIML